MQRHNNGLLQATPACAACKHQRKKCHETCPLAPYFPADRNREFQAVHKVFGVSNVTKMVKNVREEDKRKAVDSLIWEAVCRQNDPVLGPYGEYKRVLEEVKVCKLLTQNQSIMNGGQVGLGYKPIMPCLGPWNNNNNNNSNNNTNNNNNNNGNLINNGNGIMGIINGGVNSNHLFNYLHDNYVSAIIDSSPYSNSSTYNLQSPEKLMRLQQDKEITSSMVGPLQQQQQQQHPTFHHCF
ncbi:LOB domain-containing protein 2 [Cucumis melo var. makuwa]|uniref:LOB domain-containing protein 2 n=2 Tax=Cucumis melo TaxID=3656 RepID=A0A5D3CE97_CUCMM|nr:LOB domain-containing protein 2 [Cucumis melo var. makuwa]